MNDRLDLKIVFTGTPGAGKTTAITALSDEPPVVTDVANTDVALAKSKTTVGLDYGRVSLGPGRGVRLFGTPGQVRFDFMWKILAADAFGIVILLDNSRPDPLSDLRLYLNTFKDALDRSACVVGVGRTESIPKPAIDEYIDVLSEFGLVLPVLAVDIRKREDVLVLVECVIALAEARADIE